MRIHSFGHVTEIIWHPPSLRWNLSEILNTESAWLFYIRVKYHNISFPARGFECHSALYVETRLSLSDVAPEQAEPS